MSTHDDPQSLMDSISPLAAAWERVQAETPEQRAADEAASRAADAEHRRTQADETLDRKIPYRYRSAETDHPAILDWLGQIIADHRAAPSLLIAGPTGTGKTHQAYGALRAATYQAIEADQNPLVWTALTAADLYASLRPRPGIDSDPEAELRRHATIPLLMVDDLGAAKVTEWTEEVTYRLINHRYEQCLPGIFTTNLPIPELRDALGDRIASRLAEMTTRVTLSGGDRRRGAA